MHPRADVSVRPLTTMSEVPDAESLERFVIAQRGVLPRVLDELARGRKETHWMWFVFPQLRGLGTSPMAHRFGLASRGEAARYWRHAVLGPRLRTCTERALAAPGAAHAIFGSPDDLKLRSCLTLFRAATGEPLFDEALAHFFSGTPDPRTLTLLASQERAPGKA